MKFCGPLVVVSDLPVSKKFYEGLLGQKLELDLGACQAYEGGLNLQTRESMPRFLHFDAAIEMGGNDVALYFETEEFEPFVERLKEWDLSYIHGAIEYEWGQKSICFLDPDGHPVNVSESMPTVFRRFWREGLSVEEVAKRTEHPIELVAAVLKDEK